MGNLMKQIAQNYKSGELAVLDVLVGGELVQLGLLRKVPQLRLIADERAGREDNAKQIWQLR